MSSANKTIEFLEITILGFLIYYLLQSMVTLVEDIYTLDLLNTSLDAKVLGLLFFFSPVIYLFLQKKDVQTINKISGIVLILFRILFPLFKTSIELILSGVAFGFGLIFVLTYFLIKIKNQLNNFAIDFTLSLVLATLISITFRTINDTLTLIYSWNVFRIVNLIILVAIGFLFIKFFNYPNKNNEDELALDQLDSKVSGNIIGIFTVFTLIYFSFGSPAIFVRWTETNYPVILCFSVIPLLLFVLFTLYKPNLWQSLHGIVLNVWNLLFTICLTLSILLNQVKFINSVKYSPVIVKGTAFYQQLPIYLTLLLSPVIFIDIYYFTNNLLNQKSNGISLIKSFLISSLIMIILIFSLIFSNVWGYVEPVSNLFRGLMWLPYLILCGILYAFLFNTRNFQFVQITKIHQKKYLGLIVLLLCITTVTYAFITVPNPNSPPQNPTSIKIMTYNIQQGVDQSGQKNYEKQLKLIKSINPDIIGIEESDIVKISSGNIDVVRYFADNLNYYSYYGPKTVMQTYGVALLSRYPIKFTNTIYTYGDEDEIGSIYAQVQVNNNLLNIFVNHPAGSNASKMDHLTNILNLASGKANVVILGDFNWRETSQFYPLIVKNYNDTWRSIYPTGIDNNGLNMNSTIDHIFVSPTFSILGSTYIPPPASETDHPAYWTNLLI